MKNPNILAEMWWFYRVLNMLVIVEFSLSTSIEQISNEHNIISKLFNLSLLPSKHVHEKCIDQRMVLLLLAQVFFFE